MWSSLAVEGKRTMPQNQILDNLVTTLSSHAKLAANANHGIFFDFFIDSHFIAHPEV